MSKVQYYAAATLDGYIADPDDGLDWLLGYEGSFEGAEGTPMAEGATGRGGWNCAFPAPLRGRKV